MYIHPCDLTVYARTEQAMAGKSRMRPSFKKHTRRYKEVIAPAKTLEGMKKLTKKRRYANRHG